ncbi:hypothetical protein [Massilia sp. S19_KUP03_FR1]|uniref:hypothetical protein n=1 Tax=Massilia sp. S19_KUP03_FR1 TaxID=3025503 RepID=UPI002FCD340D
MFAQDQRPSLGSLIQVNIELMIWPMINGVAPQLLAAAYFLQRRHGAAFAAALLEDNGVPCAHSLRLLDDRLGAEHSPQQIRFDERGLAAAANSNGYNDDTSSRDARSGE